MSKRMTSSTSNDSKRLTLVLLNPGAEDEQKKLDIHSEMTSDVPYEPTETNQAQSSFDSDDIEAEALAVT